MSIITIVILILAILALGLLIFNVPISQRAVNIILLVLVILLALSGTHWGSSLSLK